MSADITALNESQKSAVTHGDGPLMIVAGAGTGKTTVITNRIAWLIAEGRARPDEILAVTFTEKAAAEMLERVDRLLPLGYTDLWIHTFHAFCQRVLEEYAVDIGLPNEFRILDTTAGWLLVRQNLSAFDLDYYKPLGNPTRFIHALLQHFSRCKDEGVYPEEYLAHAEKLLLDTDQAGDRSAITAESARMKEVANAYATYQKILLDNNALDFGDLINYTHRLFSTRPQVLERFRKNFSYILIDEFQDTNWMQYQLMKLLGAPKNNITVVGDDDQSIYKFRGASVSNILAFQKDFPDAKHIYLSDNYRSGQAILDVAYRFIQNNNPDRLEVKLGKGKKLSKRLTAHVTAPGEIEVMRFETGDDEARGVIETIMRLRETVTDFSWSDVAILVRANDQANAFVRYLRSTNVPHQFLAARGLYTQDVIRAIQSYLKLLDNYHESEALYHILTLPCFSIADEDVVNLTHLADKKSWSLWRAVREHAGHVVLGEKTKKELSRLSTMLETHAALARKLAPAVLIYRFLEDSGYLEYLTREDTQYTREQLLYLNQFYRKVRTWEEENLGSGVAAFIEYLGLELESGSTGELDRDLEAGPEQISVSTIHSAKGLEYRYVFIVGMVHLRFPSRERRDPIEMPEALIKDTLPTGDHHLQEERRLLYVGLTRAKEKVFLTYAENYGGAMKRKPSLFIAELGVAAAGAPKTVGTSLVLPQQKAMPPKKVKLPNILSFTQIRAFETCPKQYYYAHIIKIPSAGRATFSFGKIMHGVLQKFFEVVRERSGAVQEDLFAGSKKVTPKKSPKPVSEAELIEFYLSVWQEDWFFDEDNKKKYFEKGKKILKEFYRSLPDPIPIPAALEQPFTVKVEGVTFRGVIDRIDEQGSEWKLIDYKTGRPPANDKLTFDDKEQLLFYQLAAKDVFKKNVSALMLYFLENNTPYVFTGTPADIETLKKKLLKAVNSMKSSSFEPTPGLHCKSCDYRFICPAAQS